MMAFPQLDPLHGTGRGYAATSRFSSLITSQAILSTFFVCIFLLAAKLYRTIRGTKTFAAAYLCIMLAQICYSAAHRCILLSR